MTHENSEAVNEKVAPKSHVARWLAGISILISLSSISLSIHTYEMQKARHELNMQLLQKDEAQLSNHINEVSDYQNSVLNSVSKIEYNGKVGPLLDMISKKLNMQVLVQNSKNMERVDDFKNSQINIKSSDLSYRELLVEIAHQTQAEIYFAPTQKEILITFKD